MSADVDKLLRYFELQSAPVSREAAMAWAGFVDPPGDRVTAYVEFENALIRLNQRLAKKGRRIAKYAGNEMYGLTVQP